MGRKKSKSVGPEDVTLELIPDMLVADLKAALKAKGLSVTGKKNELIARLTDAYSSDKSLIREDMELDTGNEVATPAKQGPIFTVVPPRTSSPAVASPAVSMDIAPSPAMLPAMNLPKTSRNTPIMVPPSPMVKIHRTPSPTRSPLMSSTQIPWNMTDHPYDKEEGSPPAKKMKPNTGDEEISLNELMFALNERRQAILEKTQ